MISLGEIARLAGVRSHLEAPHNAKREQIVAGHPHNAVYGPPKLVEPRPIAPVQLNTDKTAERSASATDLYDRALRDAERQAIDLDGRVPINRSTSTPPEAVRASPESQANAAQHGGTSNSMPLLMHSDQLSVPVPVVSYRSHPEYTVARTHEQLRLERSADAQGEILPTMVDDDATSISPRENVPSPHSQASTSIATDHHQNISSGLSPTNVPPSSSIYSQHGPLVYSSTSSPTYISQHPQPAAPQGQHVYAYHTQYYAPQYSYPPPVEGPLALSLLTSGYGSPVQMHSPPVVYSPLLSGIPSDTGMEADRRAVGPHSRHGSIAAFPMESQSQSVHPQPQVYGQPYSPLVPMSYPHYSAATVVAPHYRNSALSGYTMPQFHASGSMAPQYPHAQHPVELSSPHALHTSPYISMISPNPSLRSAYDSQHLRFSTNGSMHLAASTQTPHAEPHADQHYRRSSLQFAPETLLPTSPTVDLTRGLLAQARLRTAAAGAEQAALSSSLAGRYKTDAKHGNAEQKLPKPPSHSPWALWVGNVPSDATHAELWRFFASRPPPGQPSPTERALEIATAMEDPEAAERTNVDYDQCGIESIHLIIRSNCCFVNVVSRRHLEHMIRVCNGVCLRPADPRCKPLLCRVRKADDDTKTGVGAQRGRNMHREWINDRSGLPSSYLGHSLSNQSISAFQSNSTSSTTSSFLARHFPRRYFILKSHTEDDLYLSVERGLWATQSHNEPVLDQAFRTAEGVYLIFSANRSGEFFGYAKMSSAIVKRDSQMSGSASSARPPAIGIRSSTPTGAQLVTDPLILSPSASAPAPVQSPEPLVGPAGQLVSSSPQPLSEQNTPNSGQILPSASAGVLVTDYLNPHLHGTYPLSSPSPIKAQDITEARKGISLDPAILVKMQNFAIDGLQQSSDVAVGDSAMSPSALGPESTAAGMMNKDVIYAAQQRNEQLERKAAEAAEISPDGESSDAGLIKPFKVEWIRVNKLPFHRTRHLRNAFNDNREVKISRDGTEVEPTTGDLLLKLFWQDS